MARFLTLEAIKQEYPRLARTPFEMSEALRKSRHPLEPGMRTYDFMTPLTKGWEWLFEHLKISQPKAYAAIASGRPSFLVGERSWIDRIRKERWACGGFVQLGDKYIVFHPDFASSCLEEWGEKHPCYSRYTALPDEIANAYHARMDGIEVVHQLPINAMESRVLPAKISGWARAKNLCKDRKTRDSMIAALKEVADPEVSESVIESFWVFLDTREQGNYEKEGDYLLVQNGSKSKRIYHVQDWDFGKIRQVRNAANLVDEYVAHILVGENRRFDFTAFT